MQLKLDKHSPLPLRHQITSQLRYLIESGRLSPGSPLPTMKEAGKAWGVNVNTVAGAYKELERAGYVTQRKRAGTSVATRPPRSAARELVASLAADATRRARLAGVDPADLLQAVAAQAALGGGATLPRVAVLARDPLRAAELARRAEAVLGGDASWVPLAPDEYESSHYHFTIVDPGMVPEREERRGATSAETAAPPHLDYGPDFPSAAD